MGWNWLLGPQAVRSVVTDMAKSEASAKAGRPLRVWPSCLRATFIILYSLDRLGAGRVLKIVPTPEHANDGLKACLQS